MATKSLRTIVDNATNQDYYIYTYEYKILATLSGGSISSPSFKDCNNNTINFNKVRDALKAGKRVMFMLTDSDTSNNQFLSCFRINNTSIGATMVIQEHENYHNVTFYYITSSAVFKYSFGDYYYQNLLLGNYDNSGANLAVSSEPGTAKTTFVDGKPMTVFITKSSGTSPVTVPVNGYSITYNNTVYGSFKTLISSGVSVNSTVTLNLYVFTGVNKLRKISLDYTVNETILFDGIVKMSYNTGTCTITDVTDIMD